MHLPSEVSLEALKTNLIKAYEQGPVSDLKRDRVPGLPVKVKPQANLDGNAG
jgi:hypothetical protein